MITFLKSCFAVILLLVLLICGCKKEELPSELNSDVKSYDFYAAGGAKTNDNGFIVYCNEKFDLYTISDKLVKLSSDGKIDWEYKFTPRFINDSNYVFQSIMDVASTASSYCAFIVQDSVIPALGDSLKHIYSFKFVSLNLSGQKTIEKVVDQGYSTIGGYYLFTGNILQLKSGGFLTGINIRVSSSSEVYFMFNLSAAGDKLSKKTNYAPNLAIHKQLETSSGDIILIGDDGYVSLFSTSLSLINERQYRFAKSYVNVYTNIIPTTGGNYLISGYADIGSASAYQYNYSMTLIDKNIDTLWMKTIGTQKQDYCLSSTTTADNNFALIGITNYASNPVEDYASSISLIKTDAMGNELYSKKLAEGLSAKGLLISSNTDNSYTILGTKLAYGNPNFHHTIFIHTKMD